MAQLQRIHQADPPPNPSAETTQVIFIHGLGGGIKSTWMHQPENDSSLWPAWVGADTGLTTWVLGYDAALSAWKDSAMPLPDQGSTVLDLLVSEPALGQSNLVLVGHSMGGLVIKTALVNAMTQGVARYEALAKRVRGVVFVATPHAGSQLASLAKVMSFMLRINDQVGNMASHDVHLRNLSEQFRSQHKKLGFGVRTFAETKGIFVGKKVLGVRVGSEITVVDASSSNPHVPDEVPVRLADDHLSICKPQNRNAQIHKSLLEFLRNLPALSKLEPMARQPDRQQVIGTQGEPTTESNTGTARSQLAHHAAEATKLPIATLIASSQQALERVKHTNFYDRLARGVQAIFQLQAPPAPSELLSKLQSVNDATQLVAFAGLLQPAIANMTDSGAEAALCCDAAVSLFCVWVSYLKLSPPAANFQTLPRIQIESKALADVAGLRLAGFYVAAASGRKLEFADTPNGLAPKHGHRLRASPNSEQDENQMHWELYGQFLPGSEHTADKLVQSGPIKPQEQAILRANIRAKRDPYGTNCAVFAIVSASNKGDSAAKAVAQAYAGEGLEIIYETQEVDAWPFDLVTAVDLYASIQMLFAQIALIKATSQPTPSPKEQPMTQPAQVAISITNTGPAQTNIASGHNSAVHATWNLNESQKNQLQALGDNLIQVAAQAQPAEKVALTGLGKQLKAQAEKPAPDKGAITEVWESLKALADSAKSVESIHSAIVSAIAALGPLISQF